MGFLSFLWVLLAIGIGGSIGVWRARTIQMTAMPQLVALFHALIGLAAVLVAASALYGPQGFGLGLPDNIHGSTLFEMSLGAAIGAITFTGSVIAFLKLDGRMTGNPSFSRTGMRSILDSQFCSRSSSSRSSRPKPIWCFG